MSSGFRPQTDSQMMSANKTIEEMLQSSVESQKDDYDRRLSIVEFAHKT